MYNNMRQHHFEPDEFKAKSLSDILGEMMTNLKLNLKYPQAKLGLGQ